MAAGLRFFFTGKACKHGHLARRYVTTGICVQCNRDNAAAQRRTFRVEQRAALNNEPFLIVRAKGAMLEAAIATLGVMGCEVQRHDPLAKRTFTPTPGLPFQPAPHQMGKASSAWVPPPPPEEPEVKVFLRSNLVLPP